MVESFEINDMRNRLVPEVLAVSDVNSEGILVYKNNFPVISGKVCKKNEEIPTGHSAMAIKTASLDSQLPNLQNINLLKINVNGNESNILKGASEIIKRSEKIRIICSYKQGMFGDFSVAESLIKDGFSIYVIENNGNLRQITLRNLLEMTECNILLQR